MDSIPTAVDLTTYAGGNDDPFATPLPDLCERVEAGDLHVRIGKVFHIDNMVNAHRTMDVDAAGGKVVLEAKKIASSGSHHQQLRT